MLTWLLQLKPALAFQAEPGDPEPDAPPLAEARLPLFTRRGLLREGWFAVALRPPVALAAPALDTALWPWTLLCADGLDRVYQGEIGTILWELPASLQSWMA